MSNIDKWIETLQKCKFLPENEFKQLCNICKDLFFEESNVQPIASPVIVCGDIHGQFYDLIELFKIGGPVENTNYVFMGDFVDRGRYSLETFSLLLAYKAKYPDRITLIRGNHETSTISRSYGFFDELFSKYGHDSAWKLCCELFNFLPVGAVIDGRVLCVHAGLSPDIVEIDQMRTIPRMQEVPTEGAFCDLLWSDPEDIETWAVSPRGAGYLFGAKVTKEFNHINNLELICRSHQLVQEGFKYMFPDESLVTVWSAPNYCYRCGNVAAILCFDSNMGREFKLFDAVPDDHRTVPSNNLSLPYFL